MSNRPTPETDEEHRDITQSLGAIHLGFVGLGFARKLERERDEAREIARELRDSMEELIKLNAKMVDGDCTFAGAYYCYYKGQYDKWSSANAALTKAKEVLP